MTVYRNTISDASTPAKRQLRRVRMIWCLLFLNVLGAAKMTGTLIPHRIMQALTQGALIAALLLALTVNPRVRLRGSLFLGLYTVIAVLSLMMSARVLSVGTEYRALRLILFVVVLWLLTPWWKHSLILLRSHLHFLEIIVASVMIGSVVLPHKAYPDHRLSGAIWPIPATQVAHYAAVLIGISMTLWITGLASRRQTFIVVVPTLVGLILTHTRTALVGALVGLLVACLSLYTGSRKVRRLVTAAIVLLVVAAGPLSPVLKSWLARGENSSQITQLTGRTKAWALVLAEPRPETNKILGSGMTNDQVIGYPNPLLNGKAIDSSWLSIYQNQGIVGDLLGGSLFLVLLVAAMLTPRGPARAMAVFLTTYCLVASFTESGLGEASSYLLDLTVAASLLAFRPNPGRKTSVPECETQIRPSLRNGFVEI